MKALGAIFRRELAGLFLAPLAWILLFLVLLYQANLFLLALTSVTGGEVNRALAILLGGGYFWLLMLFLPPLITMRMISEESRSGMLEFLLTAPVSDAAVVTGKALAATAFLALAFASIFLFGLLVQVIGAPPDWGLLLAVWIGAILASAFFCALGLVSSAIFSTPLLAACFAILANISLYTLPNLARAWPGPIGEWLGRALQLVNVPEHYVNSFAMGAIDSGHVLFFLAWTAAVLFLAVRVVESRRWLG